MQRKVRTQIKTNNMKFLIALALSALFSFDPAHQQQQAPDDYQIVNNKVEGGVRTIVALPSSMVCSKRMIIKVDEKTKKIMSLEVAGGCSGNLKALSKLLKGMPVKEVVAKLDGNECGNMGTSCMDQLCRILKACYPEIK